MRVHIGVDVGAGKHDRTALVMVEHIDVARAEPTSPREREHVVSHVERFHADTPIPLVADRLVALAGEARFARPCFVIDATGIGEALAQQLRIERSRGRWPREAHVHPYAITGGREVTAGGLPKQRLVNGILTAYNLGRLGFAAGLPLLPQLVRELV